MEGPLDLTSRFRRAPGGGKVVGVLPFDEVPTDCPVDEAGDAAILPGVVDIHVQVSNGLERTTQAAAAGGYLVDAPLDLAERAQETLRACGATHRFQMLAKRRDVLEQHGGARGQLA